MLGYFGLLSLFLLLFALNFFFALREWLRPQDDTPLPVDMEYVRSENYFGVSFRAKMQDWLKTARTFPPAESNNNPSLVVLEKANGEKIIRFAGGRLGTGEQHEELVYSEGGLYLGEHSVFNREIYSLGRVETGAGAQLQAVAADGEVVLGVQNNVSRWVDARRKILLRRGTVVHSRVSSMESIELEPQVSVQSLYAPLILTASLPPNSEAWVPGRDVAEKSPACSYPIVAATAPAQKMPRPSGTLDTADPGCDAGAFTLTGVSGSSLSSPRPVLDKKDLPPAELSSGEAAKEPLEYLDGIRCTRLAPDTLLVQGDLELPVKARVFSNLIVKGTLRSGLHCCFNANVKASRVELGAHNRVLENLISDSVIEVGESSFIDGNAAADQDVYLRTGVRVGGADRHAVVSAGRDVTLESNVAVRGKVVAGRMIVTK